MKIRQKRAVVGLLATDDFDKIVKELRSLRPADAVNPLFAGLSSSHELTQWHAVSAMGPVVAELAESDLEAGRVIMRRLMWSLNDESGGIGWGAPQAMAEIMISHAGLAEEFAHILVSYLRVDGNYLELAALQRGLLWGVGRMAQHRPELLAQWRAAAYLLPYLDAGDPTVRGMAAWALGILKEQKALDRLAALRSDQVEIRHYLGDKLVTVRVGELAAGALKTIIGAEHD